MLDLNQNTRQNLLQVVASGKACYIMVVEPFRGSVAFASQHYTL